MRAIILSAGKGTRLQPLTTHCPKPLLKVGGKPLIEYHIENLKRAGVTDIVINLHHLGHQIEDYFGNGQEWGVKLSYSKEKELLEVGGGILNALDLLGKEPFMVVNGDIWTDYPFNRLSQNLTGLGYLVLVDNPQHNLKGDFAIKAHALLARDDNDKTYTYSGISVLHPDLFKDLPQEIPSRLAPLLDDAIKQHQLYGEYYSGCWTDVGTIERLTELDNFLKNSIKQSSAFN